MDRASGAQDEFDRERPRLGAIAYRLLGSRADADDAVQEAWLRFARTDVVDIENLAAWLTTTTTRVCLNVLRSRSNRAALFDRVTADPPAAPGEVPEDVVTRADAVSHALLVVLDTLDPDERIAFVLHDMFAMPFDEIAAMVERTPAATRQLASRARRRVHDRPADAALGRSDDHRRVVDAFFRAARGGDLDALLKVLAPDLVLRTDGGATRPAASVTVRGARAVAGRALRFALPRAVLHPVLVGDRPGVLAAVGDAPISLMVFTIDGDVITAIDALVDPVRLSAIATEAELG